MIPTPSLPMKSCNRLLLLLKMTILIYTVNSCLIHRSRLVSECMYHLQNSMLDHVTYMATGKKTIKKKSNIWLSDSLTDPIAIHRQSVIMRYVQELKQEARATRLMKNAHLIYEVTLL